MSSTLASIQDNKSIDRLLKNTAETIAAAIDAEHVRLMFIDKRLGASSIFYDDKRLAGPSASTSRLDELLEAMLHGETPAGLDTLRMDGGPSGSITCLPSIDLLQPYGLQAGLFIHLARDASRLAMFAGRLTNQGPWGEAEAKRACELLDNAAAALGEFAGMVTILHAKHQCESTMDALPQLIALLDTSGRVIRTNMTLEKWNIGVVDQIRGAKIHDLLHPSCNDWGCRLRSLCDDMWQQFERGERTEYELHDQQLDRDLHVALVGYPESRYADAANDQARASLVVEDISRRAKTERMLRNYNEELENRLQARTLDLTRVDAQLKERIQDHLRDAEALRELNKKYTCLLETTLTGIYVIQNKRLVFCNERFSNIFGYAQEELEQLAPDVLFPEFDTETIDDAATPCQAMEPATHSNVVRGLKSDGETLWLQSALVTVDYMDSPMIVGNVIDITEKKKVEDELLDSTQNLQLLSKRLIHAQEEERKRIAAELHDSVGQNISAVKFSIENALHEFASKRSQTGNSNLQNALRKLRGTMEEIRRISMDLRPSMLDDLGLIVTINWLVRDMQSLRPEIRFECEIELSEEDIPEELKIPLFRVLQEALNNSCKHSRAAIVSIKLKHENNVLTLRIQDDGQGFGTASLADAPGLGLRSMRERVELSAGRFTIESTPGAGTTIRTCWKTRNGDAITPH